ncbi:MAG TPA: hypothetical protein VES42_10350 [Pilimelia sp.]|nr:hypothetical protein [Pilimelia sp.]
MRLRGVLLGVFAVCAVVYAGGVLLADRVLLAAPLQRADTAAWAALTAYVLVAGRSVRAAVRWSLVAGLLALGAGTLVAAGAQTVEVSRFSYGPPARSAALLVQVIDGGVAYSLRFSVPLLVACCCLAVGAARLPGRRRRGTARAGVVAGLVLTLLAAVPALDGVAPYPAENPVALWAAVLAPAVTAVLALACAAVLAGRDLPAWLAAAGLGLVGVVALLGLDQTLSTMALHFPRSDGEAVAFAAVGPSAGPTGLPMNAEGSLVAAMLLTGVALAVVGLLRAPRHPPGPPNAPDAPDAGGGTRPA